MSSALTSVQKLAQSGIRQAATIMLRAYVNGSDIPFSNDAVRKQAIQETKIEGTINHYTEEEVNRSLELVNDYFYLLNKRGIKIVLISSKA